MGRHHAPMASCSQTCSGSSTISWSLTAPLRRSARQHALHAHGERLVDRPLHRSGAEAQSDGGAATTAAGVAQVAPGGAAEVQSPGPVWVESRRGLGGLGEVVGAEEK